MQIKEEFHENLNVFHVGCEDTHNYYIPFSVGENPFADREQSSRFHLLNGKWDFCYFSSFYEAKHALEEGIIFQNQIVVPGNWQLQGYGSPVYTNDRYEIPYDPPYVPDENATGIYRKIFRLDKKTGYQYYLNFEGVDSCFYLFVNGEFAGYSQVSHCTSEFDLTEKLVNGENEITVIVLRWCDGTYLEDQDKWRMSGIIRDVYLLERPVEHIESYRVCTEIKMGGENDICGEISFLCKGYDNPVIVRLFDAEGKVLSVCETQKDKAVFLVDHPRLWSAEKPYLYALEIEAEDEIIAEKVGIRIIAVQDGVFMINDKPVKLKGVNRHDSYPDTGAASSKEQMYKDLILMKQHNINAVRCSHYPNSPIFLQMCDKLGFYVIDESDLETHGSYHIAEDTDPGRIAYIVDQPQFASAIIDRVERMVYRDINRTSVIFWSLGNESGYSKYMENAARFVKTADDTRLVHYESTIQRANGNIGIMDESVLDVVSKMYAPISWIEEFLNDKTEKRPFLQCEYCHAMGNGPGDLEDYWKLFYAQKRIAGGFIWEWSDHGIEIRQEENGRKIYGYGGDFGEDMHDSNFCLDGLTYPDRAPHTGLLEAKQVYRPIRIYSVYQEKGIYEFVNTCSFTAMEENWQCSIEISDKGKVIFAKELAIQLPPLEHKQIQIEESADLHGDSISVKFIFWYKADGLWAKAGEVAGFEQFMLSEKPWIQWKENALLLQAKAEHGLQVEDDYKAYIVKGNSFCYCISKFTGLPVSISYRGNLVTDREVKYQVFRAPVDNDQIINGKWERFHFKDFLQKVHNCTIDIQKDHVKITAASGLGYKTFHNAIQVTHSLTIWADGRMQISGENIVKENREFLPRFGIRMFLPKSFRNVRYYGYGPMESYIDKHQAAYKGMFEAQVEDMHEDYIRPQENGSHFGCDFMLLSDSVTEMKVFADKQFSFNVSPYTAEELQRAAHNYELKESGYTVFSLDYKMSGVGSNSCGPELAEAYQLNEKRFTFSFTFLITSVN